MTLQPRPASEAASCGPYAVAARDPAARSCPWDGRPTGCGRPHGSCAVTAITVCPEATILSRSVAEAQYPHARIAVSFWMGVQPSWDQAAMAQIRVICLLAVGACWVLIVHATGAGPRRSAHHHLCRPRRCYSAGVPHW